jgi:DNA-binding transcriptional regulator/RsmH inhibitor MraZ
MIHFAGTNNTFEIWDSAAWEQEIALADADVLDPALLESLGL